MGTHEYFMNEARQFLALLGTLDFWRLPLAQREGAYMGLLHAYMGVKGETAEETETRRSLMEMIQRDYSLRAAFAPLHPALVEPVF